ncbi:unnamed protein product, partial [Polarella glacialis]
RNSISAASPPLIILYKADTMVDANEGLWERLSAAAAPGGSSLEPLLRGFFESGFQAHVQQFVAERAPSFTEVCADGSHPLIWTQFHQEYRDMFEQQLDLILATLEMTKAELQEFCEWLQAHVEIFEEDSEGLHSFLEAVTASEEYESFLKAMFEEVRRQQLVAEPPQEGVAQTQELEVCVPEGLGPGQVLAVDYLGARYELVIPDGCEPGMSFRAAVTVAA